jgi:hypothetical protein
MEKKGLSTKILAIVGTALVWFPVLAPIIMSAVEFTRMGMFRNFDYLMPAELFPVALLGGLMLLWAAIRARSRRGLIGWGLVAAIVLPVIGQVIASVTGLASGAREPVGWQWALVLASLVAYSLALVIIGVGGVMLLYDLFRHSKNAEL